MYAFNYHSATSARQAANLLAKAEDAKLLAGGHTLLPTMKLRLASPANIIDLSRVAELKGIERKGRYLMIGAMTTHAEVAASAEVREHTPGLAALAEGIGDPAVRHRGTIGGSVANNDPSADYPAALLALNAVIVTNKRKIAADEFFQGMFATALEEGELITRIAFPASGRFAYAKFRNPASRYALVGVAVAKKGGSVRVAVTGAGSNGVFRWTEAETALEGRFNAKSLDGLMVDPKGLNSDIHAAADYRAHLIGVMAKRAVMAAMGK
jgi:carbon-monoxide dehydrogenase medium subunit